MTRDVVTLGPEASAHEAMGICREKGIRHIPIVEKGSLIGLVSDRDLRDVSPPREGRDQENTLAWVRVRDIMSTDLATVGPLDTIDHVAQEIYDRKIGCLPVVDGREVIGIITSQDMMRTMIELTGAHVRGSWIEVEVPNQPGALAEITDAIRDRQVNIAGVFLGPAPKATHRVIVLRLETTNPKGIAQSLDEAGYQTRIVESSAPVDTRPRES